MIRHLRPEDYRRVPWKNGLGTTVEIAREPEGEDQFVWRVSVADVVSDGPFSRFEGIDRVIVTIEGAGMRLRHDGSAPVALRAFEPHHFRGEAETECQLISGPVRDFNLMTRRGTAFGALRVVATNDEVSATLLYCARGRVVARVGHDPYELAAGETLLAAEATLFRIDCEGDARVIVVTIEHFGAIS